MKHSSFENVFSCVPLKKQEKQLSSCRIENPIYTEIQQRDDFEIVCTRLFFSLLPTIEPQEFMAKM